MLSNNPQAPHHSNYQDIISIMQAYDCSYEDAQTHFQLLTRQQQEQQAREGEEEGQQNLILGAGERMAKFTAKELRALRNFFAGTPTLLRSTKKLSLGGRACQCLKAMRRQLKCLKYVSPWRLWRAIKLRGSSNYKKITNVELNGSAAEHPKTSQGSSSEQWEQVQSDWMWELQEGSEALFQYLAAHKQLLHEVKALASEGAKVAVPESISLGQQLKPFLFVRKGFALEIAKNVKMAAQNHFRIICVEPQNCQKDLDLTETHGIAIVSYNIFQEVEVLARYAKFTTEEIDQGNKMFKAFIIKNRFFKSVLDRDLDGLALAHSQRFQDSHSSEGEDWEGGEQEAQTHQDIIRQQDMLYQSMLSTYAARQTQRQAADQSAAQLQRKRQILRQSIREQPSPCPTTTLLLTFRMPDGSVLSRNFHQSDSLQYVQDWISVCEKVQFEEESGNFELYHGYPPVLLQPTAGDSLGSIFGGETKVRLIIKQA